MERDCITWVGLDYHKDSVQVCVLDHRGAVVSNRRCANDWRAIRTAVGAGVPVRAGIEACCGAADLAEQMVDRAGWSVDLAHPGYLARIKQSPDKSDHSDARLLGDLVRVGYLPKVWLAPPAIRELRRLVRHRQSLADQRRSLKLRITALVRDCRLGEPIASPWSKAWLAWVAAHPRLGEQGRWIIAEHLSHLEDLGRRIRRAEHRLERVTAADPVVARLRKLPGVGPVTAWALRAEIGRFDRFASGKQLARFCGLSPRNASSGQRQADAGLVKAGNARLRAVLIQAAHRLKRYSRRWSALADSMAARGKRPSVIAAAVANRWVRWLHHQMIDEPMAPPAPPTAPAPTPARRPPSATNRPPGKRNTRRRPTGESQTNRSDRRARTRS